MSIYQLKREQFIPAEIDKVWAFFSSPHNLATITPPYMRFKVTSKEVAPVIFPGQIITYKVAPILGIPLFWMTEISQVESNHFFVDEQKVGPFKLWKHLHIFEPKNNGVMMTDVVHYQLPLGITGRIAHRLFIQKQLNNIFGYRCRKVKEIFG